MNADLRYRIEQHAVAVCLSWAGLCFGIGLILQRTGKAWDRAVTLPEVQR